MEMLGQARGREMWKWGPCWDETGTDRTPAHTPLASGPGRSEVSLRAELWGTVAWARRTGGRRAP